MYRIGRATTFKINILANYFRSGKSCEGTCSIGGKAAFRWYYKASTSSLSLRYNCNGKEFSYSIQIERRASNLGLGEVFYFVCPKTSHLCRVLYLYDGYFVSRYAIPGVVYESQEYQSPLYDFLGRAFKAEEVCKKYGKEFYRGKITPYGKRVAKAYDFLDREKYWNIRGIN